MLLRWVLWNQRAISRSSLYLQISRWQFGAESSKILKVIALRVEARGTGPVFFCSQPLILPSTYECKTRQNATLTGQERQGGVQLKVCKLRFVIFWLLDYFSSWEIRRLIPFCPCYLHTLLLVSLCLHKFLCCCCPHSHWNFTAEFTGRWFKCLVLAARGYFNISSYLYFISHFSIT